MRLVKYFCALALLSAPLLADTTGTWSGTFSATIPCAYSNQSLQVAGPVTLFIDEIQGRMFSTGAAFAAFPDNVACQLKGASSVPFSITGNVAGQNISDTVVLLPVVGVFRPAGTIIGEDLTLSGTGDFGGTFSLNATRTDTQSPPKFRTSDRYTGRYTFDADYSYRCDNVARQTSSGDMMLTVGDVGRGITGGIRISSFTQIGPTNQQGICGISTMDPANLSILGTLSAGTNNTVTGFIGLGGDFIPFTGTFDLINFRATAQTPGGGKFEFSLTNSSPLRLPDIRSFIGVPQLVVKGEPARLTWRAEFADKVTIDNGIGDQPPAGSVLVRPDATTVYTLTAINTGGNTVHTTTVTVNNEPNVQIGQPPRGFTQRPNEGGGTDTFTLINRGVSASIVTLNSTDAFYTFAPSSFTLQPGASQTVTITGRPSPPGVYRGLINVATTGGGRSVPQVRVAMVVLTPQAAGSVRPRVTASRVESSSRLGQNATGAISITNDGTAPLIGFAVSSVPFIDPQDGVITIPPGQTVPVSFTVNAAQRPLDAPFGAATGTVSLRYLGGPSTAPTAAQAPSTSSSSSVNVTLVHVATPVTGPGIAPPLLPGELALFIPGLGNKATSVGDLLLGNKGTTPLTSFALFIAGSGLAASAAIPQIAANGSIELPGLLKNVLGSAVPSGTAQLRGADALRTSIAAIQSNTSSPSGTYSTSLPVFRSDKATPANSAIILTGLEKSSTAQTNLFVQETSGVAGKFAIDFLDAEGRVTSSLPAQDIGAFAFAELPDAVPSNATAARITNSASSTSKLAAYAMVTNPLTNDGWLVSDPEADSAAIVPMLSAGSSGGITLYATNRTTGTVNATIDVVGGSGPPPPNSPRRRAVSRGSSSSPALPQQTQETVTIAPLGTVSMNLGNAPGFVRITAPLGSVSAVGRSIVKSGETAFGTGLQAVPVSAALAAGGSRRFTAIDDASATSRANAVPSTFRTSLQLIETNNASAVVRLTMQFTVATGSLVTSVARIVKEYTVEAGQFVLLGDLATDLIGTGRSSVGDIRNATLDVDVLSGSGRVIPIVQSVDNGSGDSIVRIE